MVKVGDRVKLVKEGGAWCSDNVGKEGTVTSVSKSDYVFVLFDNSEGDECEEDWGNPNHLELISTTPTYTIPADTETVTLKYADGSTQDIDVKARARGVPEWVKDGAWVVSKDRGEVMRLEVLRYALKAYDVNGRVKFYGSAPKNAPIVFRPFTNSDWKWGMWAELRGEKVFVNGPHGNSGVTVSSPSNKYFYAPYDQLTPTTAP